MLYKLVFLALLLIANVPNIAADNSRQLLQATPSTTGDDATQTNTNDDGTDGADDGTPDDGTDLDDATDFDFDDETDLNDDDIDNTEGPDSMDNELETTEDGSFDTTEEGSFDSVSGSGLDSTGSGSLSSDSASGSASVSGSVSESVSGSVSGSDSADGSVESVDGSFDVESEEDDCSGLAESDCAVLADDDGDAECAFNAVQNDCYSIERRDGRHGSGNFDDGYNAAKQQHASESNELTALIGVLGGIIGALVLIISAGLYYFYQARKGKSRSGRQRIVSASIAMDEDYDEQQMEINTVEDVSQGPVVTTVTDTDPMLS